MDIQPEDTAVFARLKDRHAAITHALRRLMTQQWNVCVICHRKNPEQRPMFAGYDQSAKPLVVGACCADRLTELATPRYLDGCLNIAAPDQQVVWRYMDFAKFVSMIQHRGLYFPRADKLSDPFEGAMGLAKREAEWDAFYLDFCREAITTPPPGFSKATKSTEEIEEQAHRLFLQLKNATASARNSLVSCWHGNDIESEALWRLYCPPGTGGVALKSTVGQLWESCAKLDDVIVGRVQYTDFRHSFASIQNERIFQKRVSLEHEHEIRVVLPNDVGASIDCTLVECDLSSLISAVVVSPFAPPWFEEVLAGAIERFGYSFDVQQSELLDQPFY